MNINQTNEREKAIYKPSIGYTKQSKVDAKLNQQNCENIQKQAMIYINVFTEKLIPRDILTCNIKPKDKKQT